VLTRTVDSLPAAGNDHIDRAKCVRSHSAYKIKSIAAAISIQSKIERNKRIITMPPKKDADFKPKKVRQYEFSLLVKYFKCF
jgi:hypothetical protein